MLRVSHSGGRPHSVNSQSRSEDHLKEEDRLPLSTEILESSFGLYKQLERQHSQGGFTSLLTAFGSLLKSTTAESIRRDFTLVSVKQMRRSPPRTSWNRRISFAPRRRTSMSTQRMAPSDSPVAAGKGPYALSFPPSGKTLAVGSVRRMTKNTNPSSLMLVLKTWKYRSLVNPVRERSGDDRVWQPLRLLGRTARLLAPKRIRRNGSSSAQSCD